MCDQEVDVARAPIVRLVMLERHEEVGRQRHRFPRDHEEIGVVRDEYERHAREIRVRVESTHSTLMRAAEVAGGEERYAKRNAAEQQQEEAGERVDTHVKWEIGQSGGQDGR